MLLLVLWRSWKKDLWKPSKELWTSNPHGLNWVEMFYGAGRTVQIVNSFVLDGLSIQSNCLDHWEPCLDG